jgi:hypothetical protein
MSLATNSARSQEAQQPADVPISPFLRPTYRFSGKLPAALNHLRDQPRWVAWDYRPKNGKWSKVPFDPHAGQFASVSNPTTWGTFEAALACMQRHDLAGIGLVLRDDDGLTGIDIDKCIDERGKLMPLAAEVISLAETYAEVSPSGKGLRLFALGKAANGFKNDEVGVEVYTAGRYLTVTGNQYTGTPGEIGPAPRTLARLAEVGKAAKAEQTEAQKLRGNTNGPARAHSSDFFRQVNEAALVNLDSWVPALHPAARKQPNGTWRISSKDLGRNLEEDLAYHPTGIRDHGEEFGLTPIDAVLKYGTSADALQAALWVCERLQVEPSNFGWQGATNERQTNGPSRSYSGDKQTQADRLIHIATGKGVELYHAPDGTAYADLDVGGHRETWPLKSAGFKGWLRHAYYLQTRRAPNAEAMSTAMGVIEARARFEGVERTVYLRVAALDRHIYVDLCDSTWRAIEIDEHGWRIVDAPPVRFRRTKGMLPLPDPERGGRVDELRRHLHVDDDAYVLTVSWLLASLRACGPYPILALTGEQGTGKSFTAQMLRSLVDPHSASLRSLPRDTRDLFVVAMNGHVLVFDNLSSMSAEISDGLCRLSTGGGFSTRALYTDSEEVIFQGQRPIAMTSITDVANRSDLADRLLIVRLEVIPDEQRRPEEELRSAFEAARPRILGALLDAVSHGIMQLPHTRLNRLPRMADYAVWVRACETAIWSAGMHLAAYENNRFDAVDTVLDSDPVAMALRQHMECRSEHTMTATELLAALSALVGDHVRRGRQWPVSARGLSGQLTRLAPALRRVGITILHSREADRRLIHIHKEGA